MGYLYLRRFGDVEDFFDYYVVIHCLKCGVSEIVEDNYEEDLKDGDTISLGEDFVDSDYTACS